MVAYPIYVRQLSVSNLVDRRVSVLDHIERFSWG